MKKNLDLRGVGLGIGVGLVAMLAMTAVFAWMVSREYMPREQLHLAAAGVLLCGSVLGGLCSGRGEGRWLRCGLIFLGLVLGLMGVNLTFFDGSLAGLLHGLPVIAAGAAASTALRREKKRHSRYRKRRFR